MDCTKRIELACAECRRRKRKCDGSKPQCSSCLSQKRVCVYDDERKIRKRRRDPDEVAQLEEQIEILLQRVKELENGPSSIQLTHNVESEPSHVKLTASGSSMPSGMATNNETRLSSAIDEVGNLMWKLRIGSNGDTSFVGPSSNFHFISAAEEPKYYGQSHGHQDITATELLPLHECLQDTILQQELWSIFASIVNLENHFVDPAFLKKGFGYSAEFRLDETLLRSAIFAMAACFSTRKNATQISNTFASHAESLVQRCCRTCPSLIVVRALTILCWRDLTLDNDNMAWMYNCMAAGLATHLGLHVVALQNVAGISPEDKESRIRTFWLCFRVDRIATFSLGRQCVLPWARVSTPSLQSILTPAATLAELAFNYECQLLFIFDKYMDQIYSFQFSELDSKARNRLLFNAREALLAFFREANGHLLNQKGAPCISVITFRMSYHMCLILVQRPLLRENPNSAPYFMAVQSLSASAVAITSLLRDYRKAGHLMTAPFFVVHHALTAAIMHLLSATSSNTTLRRRSVNQFRECIEALEEMKFAWKRLRKSIALLQELAHRWSVVFALPMRLSYPISTKTQEDGAIQSNSQSSTNHRTTINTLSTQDVDNVVAVPDADGVPNFLYATSLPLTEAHGAEYVEEPDLTYGIYEMGDPFEINGLNWLFSSIG